MRAATLPALQPALTLDCRALCPYCGKRCLGGPARYANQHMCVDLHRWTTRPC